MSVAIGIDPLLQMSAETVKCSNIPPHLLKEPVNASNLRWINGEWNLLTGPFHHEPVITFGELKKKDYWLGIVIIPLSQMYMIHKAEECPNCMSKYTEDIVDAEELERAHDILQMSYHYVYPIDRYGYRIGALDCYDGDTVPKMHQFAKFLFFQGIMSRRIYDPVSHLFAFFYDRHTISPELQQTIMTQIATLSMNPQKRREIYFLACFGQRFDDFLTALHLAR